MLKLGTDYALASDGAEPIILFDLGDGDIGLFYLNNTPYPNASLEIWYDHGHNGSGVNNLRIDAFGRELDLEFCRSQPITPEQHAAILLQYEGDDS